MERYIIQKVPLDCSSMFTIKKYEKVIEYKHGFAGSKSGYLKQNVKG